MINNSLESNYFTVGIFTDLSKAFDTIDNIALINKLENYVPKGKDIPFFQSYLKNHKQSITYNNLNISFSPISSNLLQG